MPLRETRTVVSSAARTTSSETSALTITPGATALNLLLDITAVTGTSPTLDVAIEWSFDGGTTWAPADTADTFAQRTAAAKRAKQFTVKAGTYRIVWTIGGTATPTFTFSASEYLI